MVGTAETVRLSRGQVAKFVIGKNEMRRWLVHEVRLQSWKKPKLEETEVGIAEPLRSATYAIII
jgi:hypothetical protein